MYICATYTYVCTCTMYIYKSKQVHLNIHVQKCTGNMGMSMPLSRENSYTNSDVSEGKLDMAKMYYYTCVVHISIVFQVLRDRGMTIFKRSIQANKLQLIVQKRHGSMHTAMEVSTVHTYYSGTCMYIEITSQADTCTCICTCTYT